MKYGIVDLETKVGEYELTTTVLTAYDTDNLYEVADKLAETFYDEGERDSEDEAWSFNGGELTVEYTRAEVITEEEFNIMKKYIVVL